LLEDTCGFGAGRKIYEFYQIAGPATARRAWSMWNAYWAQDQGGGPKAPLAVNYWSKDVTSENLIGTMDGTMPPPAGQVSFILGTDGTGGTPPTPADDLCLRPRILGSIAYTASQLSTPAIFGVGWLGRGEACIEVKDSVFFPASQDLEHLKPIPLMTAMG